MGLHTFGSSVHLEAFGEGHDGPDDRRVAVVARSGTADEALVDLDLVERRFLEIAERRVTSPEIVEREAHSERLEVREGFVGGIVVGEEHAFGDLEFQPFGAKCVIGERRRDGSDDRRIVELDRR